VPRLRELASLEVTEAPVGGRTWRASHAWLLVGCVVAATSAAAAGLLSRFDGGASQRLPDERIIREAVDAADAATLHKAWLDVKRSSVNRGAVAEEVFVQYAADSVGRVALLLWCVAAGGAVAAIAGGLACVWAPSTKGIPAR
jgi:hypothetical protein